MTHQKKNEIIEKSIKTIVNNFLGWKLPENFSPDGGISFKKVFNENTKYPMKAEPTGTNLFDAIQTEEMIRYIIGKELDLLSKEKEQEILDKTLVEILAKLHTINYPIDDGAETLRMARHIIKDYILEDKCKSDCVCKIEGKTHSFNDGCGCPYHNGEHNENL